MIKIEKTDVYSFEAATRGCRNPMESWDKSDSYFENNEWVIGENDLKLMKSLSKAGDDHAKYLRMIKVSCDVTAPLYWWKEYDTYKVGTVANSCSTMHKIHAKKFTEDDFSIEHLSCKTLMEVWDSDCLIDTISPASMMVDVIQMLNLCRKKYLDTNDKKWWWQMIQLLPTSYNQKRTIQLNYQVLKNIYFARKNHKLDEWHVFCDWIRDLPYAKQIITLEE